MKITAELHAFARKFVFFLLNFNLFSQSEQQIKFGKF